MPPEFHFASSRLGIAGQQFLYGIDLIIEVVGDLTRHLVIARLYSQIHTEGVLGIIIKYIPAEDDFFLNTFVVGHFFDTQFA
jgi:hypothetical protein